MKKRIYAAYGSNTNLQQMAMRCPNAKLFGKGILQNYKLTFRGNGYANIEECEGQQVPIVLWDITPACERALDYYEGVPTHYIKQDISVTTANGEITAMAYIMAEPHCKRSSLPTKAYYNIVAKGYKENGLQITTLVAARKDCNCE